VLPFGLAVSPFILSKVVHQVMAHLRSQPMNSFSYVDDFLLVAPTAQECAALTQQALDLLRTLGWTISLEKSCLSHEHTSTGRVWSASGPPPSRATSTCSARRPPTTARTTWRR
jgi:hypothetical protein